MSKTKEWVIALMLGAVSMVASAADIYTSDLLLSAEYRPLWQQATAGVKLPQWVRSGNGVSTPLEAAKGGAYRTGSLCKPHDCANHFVQLLIDDTGKQIWGVLIDLPESDAARETPSRFARYTWLGKPDKAHQATLMQQVQANPNWK